MMSGGGEDRSFYKGGLELQILMDGPIAQVCKRYLGVGS